MAMSGSSLEYDMLTDSRTFIISFMEIFGLLEWTNIPSFKGFHHLIKGVKQPRLIISFNTNVYKNRSRSQSKAFDKIDQQMSLL